MHHRYRWPVRATLLAAAGLAALTACQPDPEDDSAPRKYIADAPGTPYRVVSRSARYEEITVEVETTARLRNVLAAVARTELRDTRGGQLIRVVCSTGGSSTRDNLLASGIYTPGLWRGDVRFQEGSSTYLRENTRCPV